MSPTMSELENTLPGLLSREEAIARCFLERKRGRNVVFTNGVFDLLHRGHVEYLAEARALGDVLVLGLNSDLSARKLKGPNRPLNSERDRAAVLLALRSVDLVVIFDEETPAELIAVLEPAVLVKGGDYTVAQIAGADFVSSHGGQVLTIPFRDGFSTKSLAARLAESGK
ncbi:MAG: D-glycero-beta-D-manno-heptose 1-phosphate adenylyltransferase [Calditrichaeota bacterium]|nr:D-glycero-beta-D-manno-heptose 1-phosphate adenylyltransferase [Calditrichota bacterium]MCB9366393.1 D-glycero-beta-D-manno-heptose 1-phosphate adenylyltransferase [Calditrichota bacterium]MCB9391977.1 D-glycero-beta-D-manno-heptose 1-phosphate adenylyltransferase [Calditrichota bacterium]